jgi:hypothetical protein
MVTTAKFQVKTSPQLEHQAELLIKSITLGAKHNNMIIIHHKRIMVKTDLLLKSMLHQVERVVSVSALNSKTNTKSQLSNNKI